MSNSGAQYYGPATPALPIGQRETAYALVRMDRERQRAIDELVRPDSDSAQILGTLLCRLGALVAQHRTRLDPAVLSAARRALDAETAPFGWLSGPM